MLLWMLFCAASLPLAATQTTPTSIVVFDDATEQPMMGAHVTISTLNSDDYKVITSGDDGKVEVPYNEKVAVKITFIGHQTIHDTIETGEQARYFMQSDVANLNEITVTAEYNPANARNAVHNVQVMDKAEIDQKGATNLREALMTDLNSSISQDNVLGTEMSLQGLGGQNVMILIDGVPMIGRLDGVADISQINMSNVERIEIVEGPMSVVYGSNALGGVINIITKSTQKEKFAGGLNGYYESVGQYNIDGRLGVQFKGKQNHFLQVTGGRNFFNGFDLADSLRSKQWKPKEQYFGSAKYKLRFDKATVAITNNTFWEKLTNRGDARAPYFINAFDDEYITLRNTTVMDVTGYLNVDKRLDFQFSYGMYQREKHNYFKDLVSLDEIKTSAENQDTSRTSLIMGRGVYSLYTDDKKVTYQMGINAVQETGSGGRILNKKQSIGDYAVFASFKYKPHPQVVLQPAIRIAYNTKYQAPLIPTFNAKYKPNNAITLRASYGRGYRAPSIKELYLDFVDINHNIRGNEELEAETSHNTQVSVEYLKRIKQHYFKANSRLYYNNVKNQIALISFDNDLFTYYNIEENTTFGASLTAGFYNKNVEVQAGFSLNSEYNLTPAINYEKKYDYSYDASLNLTYKIPKHKLRFNLYNKYTGKRPVYYLENEESQEVSRGVVEPYFITDFTVSKSLLNDKIMIIAGGKNLLNVVNLDSKAVSNTGGTHNSDVQYSISWGRTVFVSTKLKF